MKRECKKTIHANKHAYKASLFVSFTEPLKGFKQVRKFCVFKIIKCFLKCINKINSNFSKLIVTRNTFKKQFYEDEKILMTFVCFKICLITKQSYIFKTNYRQLPPSI